MSGYWMLQSYMGTITSNCDDYCVTPSNSLVIGGLPYLLGITAVELYFDRAIADPCGCRSSSPHAVVV